MAGLAKSENSDSWGTFRSLAKRLVTVPKAEVDRQKAIGKKQTAPKKSAARG